MRGTSFGSAWVPLVAIVALFSALASQRPGQELIWGDEGTYLAMTASLARDGDLIFGAADREWAERRQPEVGVTVILQRTGRGLTYSKPVLYPLLAAPFYALLGESGLLVLNALALAAAMLAAWALLLRRGEPELAALALLSFAGCGALAPYLLWRVSDMAQFALALVGLALVAARLRPASARRAPAALGRWLPPLGGALLGLLVTMRLPNAALAAAAVAACLLYRRPWRAAAVALAVAAALALASGGGLLLTGTANPYKAERASFNGETGYPVGIGGAAAQERFVTVPATQAVGWRPGADASRVRHSALYFLIGRHTGLVLYFPLALLLALRILRRPDRLGLALAAGVAAIGVFYLVWLPENYFGGSQTR